MQVRDIMSTPVESVSPDVSMLEATGRMLARRVGCLVVVGDDRMGILTRSDVLRTVYAAEAPLSELQVKRGMSDELVTTTPESSVDGALREMQTHGIKKLPVVEDLSVAGIVTITDIAAHWPERVSEVERTIKRKDDWTD